MVEPATEPASNPPSTTRLVIRVKLIPKEPPPPAPRSSKSALLVIVGATVAMLLGWLAISTFRSAPSTEDARVVSAPPQPEPRAVEPASPPPPQPDPPTSSINEVIPDVPRSALDTIRGTIRVSVRVTIDKQGTVTDAVADDRGPSRYFERLAVGAAKQWTFTPASSEEQRIMLVKFNFTRAGATAHASPDSE